MNNSHIELSAPRGATEIAADAAPTLISRRRPTILVADDSAEIRQSLARLLHKFNYQVTTASNGGQVMELLFRENFDLLLLDLNMPEFDGWETLDRLGSFKPDLPVIVITAQPNQREWVAQGGARALVEKPFDLPLLLQTIRDLIAAPKPPAATEVREHDAARFRHVRAQRSGFTSPFRVWGINE